MNSEISVWIAQHAAEFGAEGFKASMLAEASRQPVRDVRAWIVTALRDRRVAKVGKGRRGLNTHTTFRVVTRRMMPRRRAWG